MTHGHPKLRGFTEHSVTANGFEIRYWERGDSDQLPLVAVHGAGGPDGHATGPAFEILAQRRRVIALELPGFGGSPANNRTTSGREMAATLAAAVAAVGIEKYALTGTSMGAIVALWWAVDFADNVASVSVEAPAAFRCCTTRPANLLTDRDVFIRAFNARPERKPWLSDYSPPALPEIYPRIMGPDVDESLVDALRSLEIPVLVLFGSDDGVISPDEAHHYKETIRDCWTMIVYDAAHDLKGDRPEAFAEVVDDFLTYGSKFLVNHHSTVLTP